MRLKRPFEIRELNSAEFPRTCAVLEQGVAEGVAPGFVAGLWQKSSADEIRLTATGKRRVEPAPLEMQTDTVFDLASLTKVFATSTLAALLVEKRWISWETKVASVLANYPYPEIELRHLLSHTAGFTWWMPFYRQIQEQFSPRPLYEVPIAERQRAMRQAVLAIAPEASVGEKVVYSDISFLTLGFVLEDVLQLPLDQAVLRWIWEPMGLSSFYRHTTKSPAVDILERAAATELSPFHETVLQGQVHDENCWAMGGYGGHAGAFGTAADVLKFSRALFEGFLSPEVLRQMWTRVDLPVGCGRTLGWDTPSEEGSSTGRLFSKSSVGHLGFTGTSLWIDPEAGLAVTLLSNRIHTTRENLKIRAFRPKFHDAIREDLVRS